MLFSFLHYCIILPLRHSYVKQNIFCLSGRRSQLIFQDKDDASVLSSLGLLVDLSHSRRHHQGTCDYIGYLGDLWREGKRHIQTMRLSPLLTILNYISLPSLSLFLSVVCCLFFSILSSTIQAGFSEPFDTLSLFLFLYMAFLSLKYFAFVSKNISLSVILKFSLCIIY